VPAGGYVWWYIDAISDDGDHALTIIAFIGSVFSPYYLWSGRPDPANHCAVNVALYGKSYKHWAMTERSRAALSRNAASLVIGPSALTWADGKLAIEIDEIAVPLPRRLKGRLELNLPNLTATHFTLDGAGRHIWRPLAPRARVDVRFECPNLNWQGEAYWDSNSGSEPLEAGFQNWTWSRANLSEGAVVLYDAKRRDGEHTSLALLFNATSEVSDFPTPPKIALPSTLWGIDRETRSHNAQSTRVLKTLEDAPFYARSLISADLRGERVISIHESLSLDRFSKRWVQCLLPFRMPRRIRSTSP
jgi:carotenoid 1,2-hydratase